MDNNQNNLPSEENLNSTAGEVKAANNESIIDNSAQPAVPNTPVVSPPVSDRGHGQPGAQAAPGVQQTQPPASAPYPGQTPPQYNPPYQGQPQAQGGYRPAGAPVQQVPQAGYQQVPPNAQAPNAQWQARPNQPGQAPPPVYGQNGYYPANQPRYYQAPVYAQPRPVNSSLRFNGKSVEAATKERGSIIPVLICWFFGILVCEFVLRGGFGIGIPILTIILYAGAFTAFIKKDKKFKVSELLLAIPIFAVSFGFMFHESGLIKFISLLVLFTAVPIHLAKLSGYSRHPLFSKNSIKDGVGALFTGIGYCDMPFKALKSVPKEKKFVGTILFKVLIGLLISIPVAAILISALSAADEVFARAIERFFEILNINLLDIAVDLIVGVLFGMFAAGILLYLKGAKAPKREEGVSKSGMDALISGVVLLVLCVVHIVFVIVQFRYLFTSGAALPNNLSYAGYARSGFFELCFAIGVSATIMLLSVLFIKKKENGKMGAAVSLLLTILALCNFVMCASAYFRMFKYMEQFDLSVRRLLVVWLISLIALVLLMGIIKVWIPKFRSSTGVAACVIAMTIVLSFSNLNVLVANYNVDRYMDDMLLSSGTGEVREVDLGYLYDLGPSAAPAVARLIEAETPLADDARILLSYYKWDYDQNDWRSFTFATAGVSEIYKKYNIEEEDPFIRDYFNAIDDWYLNPPNDSYEYNDSYDYNYDYNYDYDYGYDYNNSSSEEAGNWY